MSKINLLLPNLILSKMSHESEHSGSEFYFAGELSHAELLQSLTHSESKGRNLTLRLANKVAHNFLKSQQANRRSRKQLFRINCSIIYLWNKRSFELVFLKILFPVYQHGFRYRCLRISSSFGRLLISP